MTDPFITLILRAFRTAFCLLPLLAPLAHAQLSDLGCYSPIAGGFSLTIEGEGPVTSPDAVSRIGTVTDNPRIHRRPLFPPADKSLIWTTDQLAEIQRCGFRPLVVAYNEPRFLFDYHSAGGLLGHLQVGLENGGTNKWFHQWANINVSYVDGRLEYRVTDPDFPGLSIKLTALPLAHSVGLMVRVQIQGAAVDSCLTWAFGGASAFSTNYNMGAPEFTSSPEQCSKDRIELGKESFTLRRAFDESDVYFKEVFAAARYLKGWEATLSGGSTWKVPIRFGSPEQFTAGPSALSESAEWETPEVERHNVVAVQRIPVSEGELEGYIVVGMGGDIAQAIQSPAEAWEAGLERNRQIAERVIVQSPDPHLNSAVRMMAFATEGTWGDLSILHGAWSWRFAYLGWRGWYGSNCYGWPDRVKKSIENHTTLGLVKEGPDQGALASLLEYNPGVYYNMNEVFMDHVRQYFDYTNDAELMERIFPVLESILSWENRRLQPEGESLYENSLNTWISDSHWYIGGQCTQASAYMLRAHEFVADLAQRLGKDAAPYRAKAEAIRAAMQEKLWNPTKGVFAEYLDTRGNRLLHPEPELPTLYHSAEFGAADPKQIEQMLDWAKSNLRQETTPEGGKLYWSSNWFPNNGRSYTHSTHEMAYAEELNFALTQYLAGRSEEGYSLVKSSFCGIFNGPTPGGLSCHAYKDGRQRANDEFSDAISMWGRAVLEGTFGIVPKRPDGLVELTPQFPSSWPHASIKTPHFSYSLRRDHEKITLDWESPIETLVRLRIPLHADKLGRVTVDGKRAVAEIEPGSGSIQWVMVQIPKAEKGSVSIEFTPSEEVELVPAAEPNVEPYVAEVWVPPASGDRDLSQWTVVDLASAFNASVTGVLQHVTESAIPPKPPAGDIGFNYWKDHLLQYHGSRNQPISDAAWRAKVDTDGIAWATDGIPFKTSRQGPNIGVVTLNGGFPERMEVAIHASGKTLYLMLSGMTFPSQSHVPNLRVTLRYDDGEAVATELTNPFTIGDCWSTWCGRFHDTAANGFENIGGRSGPMGSIEVTDLTRPVATDTEAQLVALPLRESVTLESLVLEAVANDVIFGIMGASLLK